MAVNITFVRLRGRGCIYMQYRDPITGKKVRRSTETSERNIALELAKQWQDEINQRQPGNGLWRRGNVYYARIRFKGRVIRKRLSTDIEVAKSMLLELRSRAEAEFNTSDGSFTLSDVLDLLAKNGIGVGQVDGELQFLTLRQLGQLNRRRKDAIAAALKAVHESNVRKQNQKLEIKRAKRTLKAAAKLQSLKSYLERIENDSVSVGGI